MATSLINSTNIPDLFLSKVLKYVSRNCLTITISPNILKYDADSLNLMFSKLRTHLDHASDYFLVCELAPDTQRLHFHGCLKFTNYKQMDAFLQFQFKYNFNTDYFKLNAKNVKMTRYPKPQWLDYCFKEFGTTFQGLSSKLNLDYVIPQVNTIIFGSKPFSFDPWFVTKYNSERVLVDEPHDDLSLKPSSQKLEVSSVSDESSEYEIVSVTCSTDYDSD